MYLSLSLERLFSFIRNEMQIMSRASTRGLHPTGAARWKDWRRRRIGDGDGRCFITSVRPGATSSGDYHTGTRSSRTPPGPKRTSGISLHVGRPRRSCGRHFGAYYEGDGRIIDHILSSCLYMPIDPSMLLLTSPFP